MRIIILKFSFILLIGLLFNWWLNKFSPLNLPQNIPRTPIRIGGLLLMILIISVLIVFQKKLLKKYPEKSIFQLTTLSGFVCLISETIFQLLRQPTLDSDFWGDRIENFAVGTIGITILGTIISFLIAFQIKTKKTM